jgi:type IV fimbrial biogenesis protein FimT
MDKRKIRVQQPVVNQRGVNLPEVMAVLLIISILMHLSLPVIGLAHREESTRVLLQLAHLIEMARSSAINSQQSVTVCPITESDQCGGNWQHGAMAFFDNNDNRQRDPDEILIHKINWIDNSGHLSWRAFGNRQSLSIDAFGGLRNQNGNFTWCPPSGSHEPAHQLVINAAGRLRLAADNNGDGLREDSQGRPLVC